MCRDIAIDRPYLGQAWLGQRHSARVADHINGATFCSN
jgi:hypothetical protein